jgi:hypothetical protein
MWRWSVVQATRERDGGGKPCWRCAELEKEIERGVEVLAAQVEDLAVLREVHTRLVEALEFYANPENYPAAILDDGGSNARVALLASGTGVGDR